MELYLISNLFTFLTTSGKTQRSFLTLYESEFALPEVFLKEHLANYSPVRNPLKELFMTESLLWANRQFSQVHRHANVTCSI